MLSVIICTYNRERYLPAVLESLVRGSFSDYEIIVVDNNSTDSTAQIVASFASSHPKHAVHYVKEPVQGLSSARNCGIRNAKGDILVFVDDDATVSENYLSCYAQLFESHPEIHAAGGPIIPSYETGEEPAWMTYHLRRLLTGYLYFGDKLRPFPGDNYPGGGNAAYRKEVFEKVGPYNTSLGRNAGNLGGGEEKDIFRKMDMQGLEYVYTPDCILYHSIPESKLQEDYFLRLTHGIGSSERLRTLAISRPAYMKRLFMEAERWAGTLVLALWYTLKGRSLCASKLIAFRRNVTAGLLGK